MFSGASIVNISDSLQHGIVREMMLSNLGHISYRSSFGSLTLRHIWGPVALSGAPDEITIGIVTVDGTICMTMATRLNAPGFLGSIVDEMEKAISGMATEQSSALR